MGILVLDYNTLKVDCLLASSVHTRYVVRMTWPLVVMAGLWLLS